MHFFMIISQKGSIFAFFGIPYSRRSYKSSQSTVWSTWNRPRATSSSRFRNAQRSPLLPWGHQHPKYCLPSFMCPRGKAKKESQIETESIVGACAEVAKGETSNHLENIALVLTRLSLLFADWLFVLALSFTLLYSFFF